MTRTAVGILLTLLLLAAIWFLARDLAPPGRLTFAAGPEDGGYWRIARRYRAILARDGIDVVLIPTAGSVENAARLGDGTAQVALLQGGIEVEGRAQALAAVFLEPLFLFVRAGDAPPANVGAWRGVTIAAGPEGSGTRAAFDRLIAATDIGPDRILPVDEGGAAAAESLLAGRVDVAAFVAPLSAPYLEPLVASDEVEFLRLSHLQAISRRLPQSSVVTLPSGGLRLYPPRPVEPLPMLAMVATLAAGPNLHPALVDRLVEAAREIHAPRTVISADGAFPTMTGTALPPNPQAVDLLASGPSSLRRYLPYWAVAQVDRIAILLLPVLILLLPVLQALPGVYAWRMRRKVFRYYAAFREIEAEADTADAAALRDLDSRLAALDAEIARIRMPLAYRELAYTARLHVDLLRSKIASRMAIPFARPSASAARPQPSDFDTALSGSSSSKQR